MGKGVKKGTVRGSYKRKNKVSVNDDIKALRDQINELKLDDGNEELIDSLESDINEIQFEIDRNNSIPELETEIKKEHIEFREKLDPEKSDSVITEEPIIKEIVNEVKANTEGLDDFKNFLNGYTKVEPDIAKKAKEAAEKDKKEKALKIKETAKQIKEKEIKTRVSMKVSGSMLLSFCDILFPGVVKVFHKHIMKNPLADRVNKKDVMLDEDQLEALDESATAVAEYIFDKVHPGIIFAIFTTTMYSNNFGVAMDELKEKDEKEKIKLKIA